MQDIILRAADLDQKAVELYRNFSQQTLDPDLSLFWRQMSNEEQGHVEFWNSMLKNSSEMQFPALFDNQETVLQELMDLQEKAKHLVDESHALTETVPMFINAYRLEVYMLHPAMLYLFAFGHLIMGKESAGIHSYEHHLERFFLKLKTSVGLKTDLSFIGETVMLLWLRNKELIEKSRHDVLTTVLNRKSFFELITPMAFSAQRHGIPVGVLLADIDNFKTINDTFGHQQGDHVLRSLGRIITTNIRSSDIAGRYGGEEFIIFSLGGKADDLTAIGNKIRNALHDTPLLNDRVVTISMGAVSAIPSIPVEKSLDDIIGQADTKLYEAKRTGKDRICL